MVVRTWAMRGTLHLVATRDLGWTLAPLGPRMLANDQRRRTQLGLDAATCERALPLIRDALATRGPLTRAELAAVLAPHGIPTAGQAMPHLLYYAAYRALICFGPDHAGEPTYALIEQWLGQRFRPAPVIPPGQMVPEEARLSGLATRYIHAYGPARPEDFAAWAGVPLSLARASWRLLAPVLAEIEVSGEKTWIAKGLIPWLDRLESTSDRAPLVNLIPAYDPYLLGYHSHNLVVAPEFARRIHPGGGVYHNALLVDGRAMGGRWARGAPSGGATGWT